MRAAIVSLGSVSSKITAKAMEEYFDQVDLVSIKEIEITLGDGNGDEVVMYRGQPLAKYDCVYVKGSHNYGEIAGAITSFLSETTYMPIKAESFQIVHDKLLAHIAMQQRNIPAPRTYISATTVAAKSLLEKLNYPIIFKFPRGTHGKGVMFAESFAAASSLLDALVSLKQAFLIQEYVETGGVDVRAFVVGNEVVAAMKRIAKGDEKRANAHAGGSMESVILDPKTKKIAIDTAKSLGCAICGVDLLEGPKGALVLEANVSPGLQGIMTTTTLDIPKKIAKFLYDQTILFKQSLKGEGVSANELLQELDGKDQPSRQEIVHNVEFRGSRILLPQIVGKLSKFDIDEEAIFEVGRKHISIRKV